jgi:hypothetical protein
VKEGTGGQNCWEFMECPEENKRTCEVFKQKLGQECWHVPSINFKSFLNRPKTCITCPFFMKNSSKVEFWFKSKNGKW